jgi:hypothetical protein
MSEPIFQFAVSLFVVFEIIASRFTKISAFCFCQNRVICERENDCTSLNEYPETFHHFPYICFIDFMITHIFEHTQFEIYIKCLIINAKGVFWGENNAKI